MDIVQLPPLGAVVDEVVVDLVAERGPVGGGGDGGRGDVHPLPPHLARVRKDLVARSLPVLLATPLLRW